MHRTLLRPEALLAGTFAALILAGALLLWAPLSHGQQRVGFVDALFTATSAVCVTGLVTVDTSVAFSRFGQATILALIQLGGLGIMTFAAVFAQLFRLRLSFRSRAAWQGTFFEGEVRGSIDRALRYILLMTLLFEGLGTLLIWVGLQSGPTRGGPFEAMFHAVSAFCNAGFSVYSANAIAFREAPLVLWTLMGLITLGGLGYNVLLELFTRATRGARPLREIPVRWSLHSRVVLKVSALLSLGGGLVLAVTGLTSVETTWGTRLLHGLFQSVSARTAGFNSVDVGALPLASLLILIGLMFIGGSPGSCAGGIKTTSAAVWTARVLARARGRDEVTLGGRQLPVDVARRAALVVSLATVWNLAGILVLALIEGRHADVRLQQLAFEQVSAFATCGLSANPGAAVSLSGTFSDAGKLWIALTMFVGRVGPLTLALALLQAPRPLYHYATERVMIG